jgi:FHS family L-fucose permease-like MFS transporter
LAIAIDTPPPAAARPGERFIKSGFILGFALVTSLFFLWAIANNFNDILIRQFQKALSLSRAQAGFIQSVFYLGYFTMALPAGMVIRRFGYKGGILAGLGLYAIGALLFVPASHVQVFGFFLLALYVIASGACFLETAANPFVAHFGDPGRSAQRLNLAQSFNGLGGFLAPIIGGRFIFSGVEHSKLQLAAMSPAQLAAFRTSEAHQVQAPYLILALVVLAIALLIALTPLPKVDEPARADTADDKASLRGLFAAPGFLAAVAAQFFYVGAQVGIWSYFVDFTKDVAPQTPERYAAYFLSISLFGFMTGRFLGTALMQVIAPKRLLFIYAIAAGVLVAAAALLPGYGAVIALGLTSFFMSIMFPTIFSLGVQGLGPQAKLGSSFIIMAIIGGAIFPPLMGQLSGALGSIRYALLLPMLGFAVIALYAGRGRGRSVLA